MTGLGPLASRPFCYVTTTGRVSGKPHRIEIWFAAHPERPTVYLLSGGGRRSDWVRNVIREPRVSVRIGERTFRATARVVEDADEDVLARTLVQEKYQPGYGGDLTGWARSALPVALDLQPA